MTNYFITVLYSLSINGYFYNKKVNVYLVPKISDNSAQKHILFIGVHEFRPVRIIERSIRKEIGDGLIQDSEYEVQFQLSKPSIYKSEIYLTGSLGVIPDVLSHGYVKSETPIMDEP